MHRYLRLIALGLMIVQPAMANLKLPKSVYSVDRLDDAIAEARAKDKPMTFLYTDQNSSCGLCIGASSATVDEFARSTVMVYVDSRKGDFAKIPRAVQQALKSEAAGRFIPKSVMFKPDSGEVLHVLPYGRGQEMDANIKKAKRSLSEIRRESASPNTRPAPALPQALTALARDPNREIRTWTSVSGDRMEARLLEEQGPYCVLQSGDGQQVKILAERLSPADRTYINSLKQSR